MPRIHTPRLTLIPATAKTLNAELEGRASFARAIGVDVTDEWPPELYDESAIRWVLTALERDPQNAEWGMYYVARSGSDGEPVEVIGTGGLTGPPDATGLVELGYGIVPSHRRRGYAREMVDGLLAFAFSAPRVTRVIAHTLIELVPSIGVLRSAGFTFTGRGNAPTEPDAVRYDLTRDEYSRSLKQRAPVRFTPPQP